MILPNYHQNTEILHLGTCPNRSYYIPCASKEEAVAENPRTASSRMQLLNGTWDFRYYASVQDLEALPETGFDQIPVPSCWQILGYDQIQYVDEKYPFPFDPPYVPLDTPCGVYRKTFRCQHPGMRCYLNFEGVDSCFYMYLNGEFVGYSQVSHCTHEFEITDLVKDGDNELTVVVLKWCDGSYLEDQDKFRFTGIFRDVYLLFRPMVHIRDFFVHTECDFAKNSGVLRCELDGCGCTYRLEDAMGNTLSSGEAKDTFEIAVENVQFWNAEYPNLYRLFLETADEIICTLVGFREITVKKGVVYVNDVAIKFRGTNRNESSPWRGAAITREDMLQDLHMIKQSNFNAIRTSHYPNAPEFYDLCDRLGFYVMDEADIESHGCLVLFNKPDAHPKYATIAASPMYCESFRDRAVMMVERDKNHPCIVMWSGGNESGFGMGPEASLAFMAERDPSRLRHYECTRVQLENAVCDFSNVQLFSRMYAPVENIEKYFADDTVKDLALPHWEMHPAKDQSGERLPFMQCEYAHVLGNGPGDAEEYWQCMNRHPGFCGSFVWEWCDHAIGKHDENGKQYFLYGGDHNELFHNNDFCLDGLVYPDRRPSPGLIEFKNVLRPARINRVSDSTFEITNYLDFTDLDELAQVEYACFCDGVAYDQGAVSLDSVRPHETKTFSLSLKPQKEGRCLIRFKLLQKTDTPWAGKGYELGFEEIFLSDFVSPVFPAVSGTPTVTESSRSIVITGNDFTYTYDKNLGTFSQMERTGVPQFKRPMAYNIWRAPISNDCYIRKQWEAAGYNRMIFRPYETQVECNEDGVQLTTTIGAAAIHLQKALCLTAVYHIDMNGDITVKLDADRNMEMPFLPRFGMRMFLNREGKDEARYLGFGPGGSYNDLHHGQQFGLYTQNVEDYEPFIQPQENSSHWGSHWVELGNLKLTALHTPFSFNASVFSQEELEAKDHDHLLVPETDCVILCVDGKMSGTGSNACGPALAEEFQVCEEYLSMEYRISFSK